MILFLHGEDEYLVGRRKRVLIAAFLKKYVGAECFVFDFEDQGTPADVRRAFDSCEGGLFAAEKMVVFLHPFVLGETSEKLMTQFLEESVVKLPEKTILLFVHIGKIKKTSALTKLLLAKMDKEEIYDAPLGRATENLVTKELALFNDQVQFDTRALPLFIAYTKGNTARMMTELEKLATWKGEGVMTEADVRELLEAPDESLIFHALDALGRGNRKQALLLFRQETEKSEGVFPVLSMCAWQIRRLLVIREAYDEGIRRPSDIAVATKLPPFTVQKAMATIEQLPLSRIKNGLALLSDIDTNLKQGKADPAVSLDLFVWKF